MNNDAVPRVHERQQTDSPREGELPRYSTAENRAPASLLRRSLAGEYLALALMMHVGLGAMIWGVYSYQDPVLCRSGKLTHPCSDNLTQGSYLERGSSLFPGSFLGWGLGGVADWEEGWPGPATSLSGWLLVAASVGGLLLVNRLLGAKAAWESPQDDPSAKSTPTAPAGS